MSRSTWDETWFAITQIWAQRSTCPRAYAGAVLVTADNQQLASGYNGAPRGLEHCTEVGCRVTGGHCTRALHAEANALMQAARLGIAVLGSTCYCTHRPCQRCTGLLIQAGVTKIRYLHSYGSDDLEIAEAMARAAYVELERVGR